MLLWDCGGAQLLRGLVAGGEQGKDRGHLALGDPSPCTALRNHFTWLRAPAEEKWRQQESLGGHQHMGPEVWAPPQGHPELPASPNPMSGLSEKLEINLIPPQCSLAVSKLRITPINAWRIEKIPCSPACCLLCVVVNKAKAADGTCRHRGLFRAPAGPG